MALSIHPPEPSAFLFEVAWEVCNQVGGIYTVIKTKAPTMIERWGERFVQVGPYNPQAAQLEFEQEAPPPHLGAAIDLLAKRGLPVHYGRWLVTGRPPVILVDYRARNERLAEDKYLLWQDNQISTPPSDGELDSIISFGFALTELFLALSETLKDKKIIAHFHEWVAGVAIPRLRFLRSGVKTVFTTHATLLGRYIASDNRELYHELPKLNPFAVAEHYQISARFLIERAAAHGAHVFTTISDVTAREATHLLGRKPDGILPNGLNPHRFTALHEFQNLHLQFKQRIHEFTMAHFFPSYSFDLDRTLYFFISGRYEYRNKGMDIFIEALFRLNQRLKDLPNPPTVVAFVITRAATKSLNVNSMQNALMFEDLKAACEEVEYGISKRILNCVARGQTPGFDDLLNGEMQVRLKRAMLARKRGDWPPIVTHDLWDDINDPVMKHFRHRELWNSPNDPVKVVFHPEFVSMTSPLFKLDYDQFVRGCHIGVFPSYYEPWGYTPLECLALGHPTVTSDLSGFGGYVQEHIPDALQSGILVLNRSTQSNEEAISDLAHFLFRFCELSRRERIALRNRAERLTERFTWATLGQEYHRAHDLALIRSD